MPSFLPASSIADAIGCVSTGGSGYGPLRGGANELTLEIVGKDARAQGYSDGYLVGIDGFILRRAP